MGEGGKVSKVLPVSTGNGEEFTNEGWTRRAITPTGRFKVHNKIKGWRKSPLGRIYYPVYFLSGIAIHGYSSVPVKAASHGCVRIPMHIAEYFPIHGGILKRTIAQVYAVENKVRIQRDGSSLLCVEFYGDDRDELAAGPVRVGERQAAAEALGPGRGADAVPRQSAARYAAPAGARYGSAVVWSVRLP